MKKLMALVVAAVMSLTIVGGAAIAKTAPKKEAPAKTDVVKVEKTEKAEKAEKKAPVKKAKKAKKAKTAKKAGKK